jgi:hypothetical protein
MDEDNDGGVLSSQLIPRLRELDEQQRRLLLTLLKALESPDLNQKQRSTMPDMIVRLLQHAKASGYTDYDEDGVPVDEAGKPVFPPSEEDSIALVLMVLAAHPEQYAKSRDGRWGLSSRLETNTGWSTHCADTVCGWGHDRENRRRFHFSAEVTKEKTAPRIRQRNLSWRTLPFDRPY